MAASWQEELDGAVDGRFDQLVAIRRHLHMHPELSGQEHGTTLYLYQLLGDESLQVRMGPEGRGIIADLNGDADGNGNGRPETGLLALRADIDALEIHDKKHVQYRSRCDGVMHACGHDAVSAVLFGAITTLNRMNDAGALPWPVRVRAVFQPSEETCTGAKEMIEFGCLEGVDAILAAHCEPALEVGRVGLRKGVMTANCDDMKATIVGRGGHAARPHESIDPIIAASQLTQSLYLFVPRATDSRDAVVVTVGQIIGGNNPNVIPERIELRGTVRTLDREVRLQTLDHIRRLAVGVAQTTGANIEVQFDVGSYSVVNDPSLTELLHRVGLDVLGAKGVRIIARPSMGSEDFSHYLEHVPGAMFRLGCATPGHKAPGLHTQTFDVEEDALRIGAKIMARAAVLWADPARRQSRQQEPAQPREAS